MGRACPTTKMKVLVVLASLVVIAGSEDVVGTCKRSLGRFTSQLLRMQCAKTDFHHGNFRCKCTCPVITEPADNSPNEAGCEATSQNYDAGGKLSADDALEAMLDSFAVVRNRCGKEMCLTCVNDEKTKRERQCTYSIVTNSEDQWYAAILQSQRADGVMVLFGNVWLTTASLAFVKMSCQPLRGPITPMQRYANRERYHLDELVSWKLMAFTVACLLLEESISALSILPQAPAAPLGC